MYKKPDFYLLDNSLLAKMILDYGKITIIHV